MSNVYYRLSKLFVDDIICKQKDLQFLVAYLYTERLFLKVRPFYWTEVSTINLNNKTPANPSRTKKKNNNLGQWNQTFRADTTYYAFSLVRGEIVMHIDDQNHGTGNGDVRKMQSAYEGCYNLIPSIIFSAHNRFMLL